MKRVVETERLILRELYVDDFVELCKILQNPSVMYAYDGAFSDHEVHDWLQRQMTRYQDDGFGLWAMILKDNGEFIGQCGLTIQEYNDSLVPEVGYLLRGEYWHHGFATEAAIACKNYAFDTLNFDRVYSIIRDTNIASQSVALRNGMSRVGAIVKHYRNVDMLHFVYCVDRH